MLPPPVFFLQAAQRAAHRSMKSAAFACTGLLMVALASGAAAQGTPPPGVMQRAPPQLPVLNGTGDIDSLPLGSQPPVRFRMDCLGCHCKQQQSCVLLLPPHPREPLLGWRRLAWLLAHKNEPTAPLFGYATASSLSFVLHHQPRDAGSIYAVSEC